MSTSRSNKKKFTDHEIRVAIKVARECKSVKNWVEGQAKFLGVELDSEEGKAFIERESDAAARRLLDL